MKRVPTDRVHAHLDRGGRVFLPAGRMRGIRWEESVARSRMRRDGIAAAIEHVSFSCGIECRGIPVPRLASARTFAARIAGGTIEVDAPGTIAELTVSVAYDPPATIAVRLSAHDGRDVRWVSRHVPSPWLRASSPWSRHRAQAVALAGTPIAGTWKLVVLDRGTEVPVQWSMRAVLG